MKTTLRILVAVKPEGLSRVISHLLAGLQDVDVICCLGRQSWLVRYAQRLLPHLIIVNSRFVNIDPAVTVEALKNASPGVKVILTSWHDSFVDADRECVVDARLSEASLTGQLIPTVRRLCGLRSLKPSGRTPKRRFQ